ncbi:LOW QUALITY PROTEIN: hypothetical protein Cgig2_003688 [Carnegiea gigantea]|uniref:Uncharacterized protein n=1 Tax=Carnegiea gigantea TaxID=171969 RepID=A0A9Q1KGW0_9CARY|nr:LOW QUALITY PROTEIN: hypothetical protein Cgig2_003688 [Carnegiea gigantea]
MFGSSTTFAPPLGNFNTTTLSAESEATGTTHAANAPLRRWRVGLRTSVFVTVVEFPVRFWQIRGFGTYTEEEGSQQGPSSAARVEHASPLQPRSDDRPNPKPPVPPTQPTRHSGGGAWWTCLRCRYRGGISGVVLADRGFGTNTEEEGSQQGPSSAALADVDEFYRLLDLRKSSCSFVQCQR